MWDINRVWAVRIIQHGIYQCGGLFGMGEEEKFDTIPLLTNLRRRNLKNSQNRNSGGEETVLLDTCDSSSNLQQAIIEGLQ